jgi:hypothetical protein
VLSVVSRKPRLPNLEGLVFGDPHAPEAEPGTYKGDYQAKGYEPLHLRAPVTTKSICRLPHWPQTSRWCQSGTDSSAPVALRHRGRVRLDLMPAIAAPHDQADASSRRSTQCHRRAGVPVHRLCLPAGPSLAAVNAVKVQAQG